MNGFNGAKLSSIEGGLAFYLYSISASSDINNLLSMLMIYHSSVSRRHL